MSGSVFFVGLLVVVGVVLAAFASPILLIPVVVVGLGALLIGPLLGKLRGSAIAQPDPGPSGVPTTREASYEPVSDPNQTPRGSTLPND